MAGNYATLAPDLTAHADRFRQHLREEGCSSVRIEYQEVTFPATPTLLGIKGSSRHFVEVSNGYVARMGEWARYCRIRQQETFVSLVVPDGTTLAGNELATLRDLGVGYYFSGPGGITEILRPRDLAVALNFPELETLPPSVRKVLRPVYRKFENGDILDAFKDACQLVEANARRRVVKGIVSTRMTFVRSGRPLNVSEAQVERMTIGQLAKLYSQITAPNRADIVIGEVLGKINGDRIGAVHMTDNPRARARVRRNVALHMWGVASALKELL